MNNITSQTTSNLPKSVIFSCFLAGCLEMYDFVIFGFFAPLLHKEYLSFLDSNTALIIAYALFAVGFVFRPLGALIFGYIGDIYGRKPALVLSVSLMGTASLIMFFLPTYEQLGVGSCYLIALVRIIQGISVGGEYNGACIYAIEHSNKKNMGLVGAIVTVGSTLGVLLATFVSKVIQHPALPSYSWRFAFLLGFGLSIVGYFIRSRLSETPSFKIENFDKRGVPLIKSFSFLKIEFLVTLLVSGANNANFYFLLIFIPTYLKSKLPYNLEYLGIIMTIVMVFLVPVFGWVSDKFNRTYIIISACSIIGVYNLFFLDLVISASSTYEVITYAVINAIVISSMVATINIFVIEIFPIRYRFSCAGLGYSLGASIFGGTVPMVAAWIISKFEDVTQYLSLYMFCLSMLGVIGAMLIIFKNKTILSKT
jgi:MHS family proline/betaine transporter-like MFS transporter